VANFAADMARSRTYMPALKRIVGEHLIGEAPAVEDKQHNTDLIVLKLDAVRVACRIRRFGYFDKYHGEFTIRSGRPSGVKTELAKLLEGWGDYFLYGFADESDADIFAWTLADLRVFRLWFFRRLAGNQGKVPGTSKDNHDESSSFHAFRWDELPPDFIIARHVPTVAISPFVLRAKG